MQRVCDFLVPDPNLNTGSFFKTGERKDSVSFLETIDLELLNKHATGLDSIPWLLQPPAFSCWYSASSRAGKFTWVIKTGVRPSLLMNEILKKKYKWNNAEYDSRTERLAAGVAMCSRVKVLWWITDSNPAAALSHQCVNDTQVP